MGKGDRVHLCSVRVPGLEGKGLQIGGGAGSVQLEREILALPSESSFLSQLCNFQAFRCLKSDVYFSDNELK